MRIPRSVVLIFTAAVAFAQVATEANRNYQTKEGRAALASGLDSHERDARQRPAELVQSLGIKPGETVVDLGTGPGYMLPWLSRAVGPSGKVLAEDIQNDFLERARDKARRESLDNVVFILGADKDPELPPDSADLVLVLDVYHHFDYPAPMLAGIRRALRPGGRLAIVEFYKRPGSMGDSDPNWSLRHIRLDAGDLVKEVEANGYSLVSRRDHIPGKQYIAIFTKAG